jgi:hypothetical protein
MRSNRDEEFDLVFGRMLCISITIFVQMSAFAMNQTKTGTF